MRIETLMGVSQLKSVAHSRDPVAGGFYTVREAGRLLNIPNVRRIAGWLKGYPGRAVNPLISREYEPIKGITELSFWDLLEVRFIEHFRRQGVSAKALRIAAQNAREVLHHKHPFATSNITFMTDRRDIFLAAAEAADDRSLLNLVTKQYEIYIVIENILARGITFSPSDGLAERWKPDPVKYSAIVLDPLRAYGQPVLEESGVPTSAIFATWKAENADLKAAAEWYEVDESLAQQAIEFELELPN